MISRGGTLKSTMESKADKRTATGSNPVGTFRSEGQDLCSPPFWR